MLRNLYQTTSRISGFFASILAPSSSALVALCKDWGSTHTSGGPDLDEEARGRVR